MFGKLSKTKTYVITLICLIVCICFLLFLINFLSKDQKEGKSKYIILAANDLGMHCYQSDYSNFLILPPGNNLKVQVFLNEGGEAKLINSGIEVSYEIINNTTSSNKINFWQYAADYGYNVPEDIGITGNGLKGKMVLSDDKKYYIATAVPVTPYNDGRNSPNPYQMAKISVIDKKTGKELAKISSLVVPVSDEMKCETCHGGATDASVNILKAHDELSGTNLTSDLEKG